MKCREKTLSRHLKFSRSRFWGDGKYIIISKKYENGEDQRQLEGENQ